MGIYQANIYSEALGMYTDLYAYLPQDEPSKRKQGKPDVLILLHGITGDASSWTRRTKLEALVEKYNIAVFMPSGGRSFYHNMQDGPEYLTYISEELPKIIYNTFNVNEGRDHLIIAGLSMGGHGAMLAGLTHPETIGFIGSFSAIYRINDYINEIKNNLTDPNHQKARADFKLIFGNDYERIDEGDLHNLLKDKCKGIMPNIYISCGSEDILLNESRRFHDSLSKSGVKYQYEEFTGNHEWNFWAVSLERMLASFFDGDKQ